MAVPTFVDRVTLHISAGLTAFRNYFDAVMPM